MGKNYNSAKKYFEENGNLIVPKSFKTADGVLLHSWINNQKNNYKQGKLSEEKADRLRLIGINFYISKNDLICEKNFNAAVNYYNIHGNLDVPNPYKIDGDFDLGDWIYRQRKNRSELSDGQIKKLDSIGMIWVKRSASKNTNGDVKSKEKQDCRVD